MPLDASPTVAQESRAKALAETSQPERGDLCSYGGRPLLLTGGIPLLLTGGVSALTGGDLCS